MMTPEVGDRIELVKMPEDPDPILPGEKGWVTKVTHLWGDSYQVSVRWDSGRTLSLAMPPDVVRVIREDA